MPYPNEHACRLKNPDTLNILGSEEREHNGKKYRIIFGRPKGGDGGSVEQAYRYPKDTWGESEARNHCNAHDGSFEPAATSAAFEMSFLAALQSVNLKEKTAKFYLMNTSQNRNGWGVTEKALTEALPTLTKTFLGVGLNYKAEEHYPENQVLTVGKFVSYEQPQPNYAFGTAAISDAKALDMMQKGELGPVSVVIHAYRVVCSKCGAELEVDDNAQQHSCIKEGAGYEQVESFVFNRVDFVDVPAYPQAGLLEMLAKVDVQAVPIELLAGFYISQVQPPTGHDHKKIGAKTKLSDTEKSKEELAQEIAALKATIATLETENAALKKKAQETPSTKEECEAAGGTWNSETDTCTMPSVAALKKKLDMLEQERHSANVEAAFKARAAAGVIGKPEDERAMLTKLGDDTLKILTNDAAKTAAALATVTATPKTRYEANTGTDFDAAVKAERERLGFAPRKEAS